MNIEQLMNKNTIKLELDAKSMKDAVEQLAHALNEEGRLTNEEEFINDVLEREEEFTTGVGNGVAIPHGKSSGVKDTSVVFARLKEGIDWNSVDGEPVKMIFLLAIKKEDASDTHLRILSKIATNLMKNEFLDSLFNAENEGEIISAIAAIN